MKTLLFLLVALLAIVLPLMTADAQLREIESGSITFPLGGTPGVDQFHNVGPIWVAPYWKPIASIGNALVKTDSTWALHLTISGYCSADSGEVHGAGYLLPYQLTCSRGFAGTLQDTVIGPGTLYKTNPIPFMDAPTNAADSGSVFAAISSNQAWKTVAFEFVSSFPTPWLYLKWVAEDGNSATNRFRWKVYAYAPPEIPIRPPGPEKP